MYWDKVWNKNDIDERRDGMVFHYYSDDELKQLFSDYHILHMETDENGNRHMIIKF